MFSISNGKVIKEKGLFIKCKLKTNWAWGLFNCIKLLLNFFIYSIGDKLLIYFIGLFSKRSIFSLNILL